MRVDRLWVDGRIPCRHARIDDEPRCLCNGMHGKGGKGWKGRSIRSFMLLPLFPCSPLQVSTELLEVITSLIA
jgi:hypothetical protein